MPFHLDLVKQMVAEGRSPDWVVEQIVTEPPPNPLEDLYSSLATAVQSPESDPRIMNEMLVLAESMFNDVLNRRFELEFQVPLRQLLVNANIAGAEQLKHGHLRASRVANAAIYLDSLAELGIQPIPNLKAAIDLFERAFTEGFEKGAPEWARTLLYQGRAKQRLALFGDEPIPNLIAAIDLYERTFTEGFQKGTPDWATALMNLGAAKKNLAGLGEDPIANLFAAIDLYERTFTEGFQKGTLDWARALMNQGNAMATLADLGEKPIPNLTAAVELHERTFTEGFQQGTPNWARVLTNQGNARQLLADLGEEPIPNLKASVELYERAFSEGFQKGTLNWATALLNQAGARQSLAGLGENPVSNLITAIKLYERTFTEGFQKDTPDWASALASLALAKQRLADFDEDANSCLTEAVDLYERSYVEGFQKGTPAWARALMNQASCYRRLCEQEELSKEQRAEYAPKAAKVALRAFEEGLIPGSTDWIRAGTTWARTTADPKLRSEKLGQMIQTVEGLRSLRKASKDRSEFLERFATMYALYVATLIELGEFEQAWHTAHLAKNRTVLETVQKALPPPSEDPQVQALYREIMALRDEITSIEMQNARGEALIDLHGPTDRYRALVQEYSGSVPVPDLANVFESLRGLDDDAILIELVVTPKGTYVFHYDPRGEAVLKPTEVPFATTDWVNKIANQQFRIIGELTTILPETRRRELQNELATLLEELGKLLAAIEQQLPAGDRTLVLSPHGHLAQLPLAAATWGGKSLIERHPVVILPVPTLARQIADQTVRPNGVGQFLANADRKQECGSALQYTDREVEDACKSWKARTSKAESKIDASYQDVLSRAKGAGVLHLSGHSKFNHQDPRKSFFFCTDGALHADVIAEKLDLSACNLVFLSSCESGGQAIRAIDSFAGLAYGFFQAGAPAIIAPLWYAYDDLAKEFALAFYKEWLEPGVTLARAFQRAMCRLKREQPDRVDGWSSWQLMGGWNTLSHEPEAQS